MYIIDGYNLLYKVRGLFTVEDLIYSIEKFSDFYKKKVILVFDGSNFLDYDIDSKFLKVNFVEDADSFIKDLIKGIPNCIIVTSDRDIIKFAKNNKVKKIILSEDFDFSLPENYTFDEKPKYENNLEEFLKLFSE